MRCFACKTFGKEVAEFDKIKKMKKINFLFLFLLFTSWADSSQIIRGPYLEDPTQTTLVMRWQTDTSTPAWLEYGPAPRCNQIMTLTPQGTQHKVVLYGLVPNQDFCYRVYVYNHAQDGVQEPVAGTFRTLFSAERKIVKFVALGATASSAPQEPVSEDPQETSASFFPFMTAKPATPADDSAQARQNLAARIAEEKSDFLIHTGNLTRSGLNADANAEFFTPFEQVLRNMPLFVAVGPNEYGPDRQSRESKPFFLTNYRRFHDMSWSNATPKYYSFDSANARFIFLDTNVAEGAVWAPDITEKSAQVTWLKSTLAGAGEKWKIVVMNAPAYSSGVRGANNEVFLNLVKIFEEYRVNLVLQGGDRNYERTFPMFRGEPKQNGVTYVTLGTAAATPTKRENPHPSTARFVSQRHYASVKIVDRRLSAKVYSDKGKLLDSFDLYL